MTGLNVLDVNGEVLHAVVDARSLLGAAGIDSVQDAETGELAEFTLNTVELRRIAAEAAAVASDELVARLDANAKWTLRQDDWEVKAPSPAAGSVRYDTRKLRGALSDLVTDGVISAQGASAALERIEPTVAVPYWLLRDALQALTNPEQTHIASGARRQLAEIIATEPAPEYRQHLSGIKALLKVPDARDAIEGCEIPVNPPRRTATVKRVRS